MNELNTHAFTLNESNESLMQVCVNLQHFNFGYLIINRLQLTYADISQTQAYFLSILILLYPAKFSLHFFCKNYYSLTRYHDDRIRKMFKSLSERGFLEIETPSSTAYYTFTPKFDRFRADYIKQYEYLSNRRAYLLNGKPTT